MVNFAKQDRKENIIIAIIWIITSIGGSLLVFYGFKNLEKKYDEINDENKKVNDRARLEYIKVKAAKLASKSTEQDAEIIASDAQQQILKNEIQTQKTPMEWASVMIFGICCLLSSLMIILRTIELKFFKD